MDFEEWDQTMKYFFVFLASQGVWGAQLPTLDLPYLLPVNKRAKRFFFLA
jgi:hypothetical protein